MWVLATIYRALLLRIRRRGGDVFRHRVSVPTRVKLWVLGRGLGMAMWNRVRG
jgi:phytoene/squalene synthetase